MEQKEQPAQRTEHIDLAHANIHLQDANSNWIVRKNITGKELVEFSKGFKKLTELELFEILNFARKYELIAFNTGINFQKEISTKIIKDMKEDFQKRFDIIREENERLSKVLMQHIGAEEDLE